MKHTHVERSRHMMSQHMAHEKKVHLEPDYFGEALRILDNDITLEPQREHLAALWGLVVGMSRRLTQASTATRKNRHRRPPFPAAGLG